MSIDIDMDMIMNKLQISVSWDNLAKQGFLEGIKWLHKTHKPGYSITTVWEAVCHGHLNIIKFLHENCNGGFTTDAMDWAAKNGHLKS